MSDTAETIKAPNGPDAPMLLDGEAPRLASAPAVAPPPAPAPMGGPGGNTMPPVLADSPALPLVSPVLEAADAPVLPDQQPSPDQPGDDAEVGDADADTNDHPMAHLMPAKAAPSEASRRAAELRAAKKAKGRKIKLGVAAGALVVSAVVGPPLFSWLTDAINEAGDTSTEQPAD